MNHDSEIVFVKRIRCKAYPNICNHQIGHSGKYCGKTSYCKHKKVTKEGEYIKERGII